MFLQKKIDRAVRWSRERKLREQGIDPEQQALEAEVQSHGKGQWKEKSPLPSMEEILREEREMVANIHTRLPFLYVDSTVLGKYTIAAMLPEQTETVLEQIDKLLADL